MQKPFPLLNIATHEFGYIAKLAIKGAAHNEALEFHLNAITERLNEVTEELGCRDTEINAFKQQFLAEISALLDNSDSDADDATSVKCSSSNDSDLPNVVISELLDRSEGNSRRISLLASRMDDISEILRNRHARDKEIEKRLTVLEELKGDESHKDLFDSLG